MQQYENTIQNIDQSWGIVPDSMKTFSTMNDMPSWKNQELSEMDALRASYLINIDEMYSEMLGENSTVQGMMPLEMRATFLGELAYAVFHGRTTESAGHELRNNTLSFDERPVAPGMKNRVRSLFDN
jgi:hypothetical protein